MAKKDKSSIKMFFTEDGTLKVVKTETKTEVLYSEQFHFVDNIQYWMKPLGCKRRIPLPDDTDLCETSDGKLKILLSREYKQQYNGNYPNAEDLVMEKDVTEAKIMNSSFDSYLLPEDISELIINSNIPSEDKKIKGKEFFINILKSKNKK